jgi:hypothetical protein
MTSVLTPELKIRLSPEERLSCLLITHRDFLDHQKIKILYEEVGDERTYAHSLLNQTVSIAADALRIIYPNKLFPDHWFKSYESIGRRIQAYMEELDNVASEFASQDIPLIALKNSGISRALYPFYGACPMGDLDVLISKSLFQKAHDIMVALGYSLEFRSPLEENTFENGVMTGGTEYFKTLRSGDLLWFELQWRPIAGRWISIDREPKADDLIERSIPISGSQARLLSPEDNLLQVCIHTAKHSFVRAPGFRLHTDVDRIVRCQKIDWETFITLVNHHRVRTASYFSLALASDLLNTPVPSEILTHLSPPSWKVKMIRNSILGVGLFDPDGKKWNKFTYLYFVTLLFDDARDIFKNLFPSFRQIARESGNQNLMYLPYGYIKRILTILWKRNMV